jgi:cytochrome bd-type quinol oxidase subunit 2
LLGFGKRAHELATAGDRAGEQRAVLSRYSLNHLRVILWILAVAICLLYILYTVDGHTRRYFGTPWLPLTAPFAVFGVIRFLWLLGHKAEADSPTEEMLRDLPFMANLVSWAIVTILLIYIL